MGAALGVVARGWTGWDMIRRAFCGFRNLGTRSLFGVRVDMCELHDHLDASIHRIMKSDVKLITDQGEIIGREGGGTVYRGEYPADSGKEVAVKVFNICRPRDVTGMRSEIDFLFRSQHSNIISLLGVCCETQDSAAIFVERLPSVDSLVHGEGEHLNWPTRLRIARDVGVALKFIHTLEPPILHLDVKLANIFFEHPDVAKLGGFGLAILLPQEGQGVVETVEKGRGTRGYSPGNDEDITLARDVFSFGVVLLELITGKLPYDMSRRGDDQFLYIWASKLINRNSGLGHENVVPVIADHKLGARYNIKWVGAICEVASRCVNETPARRPALNEVIEALNTAIYHEEG